MTRHKQFESSNQKENSVCSQIKMLYKINLMYLMIHNCFYGYIRRFLSSIIIFLLKSQTELLHLTPGALAPYTTAPSPLPYRCSGCPGSSLFSDISITSKVRKSDLL